MQALRVRSESARRLRLVVRDGERLAHIPAIDEPEAEMEVAFEGLSEAAQRRALAAFPGGRRFKLLLDRRAN